MHEISNLDAGRLPSRISFAGGEELPGAAPSPLFLPTPKLPVWRWGEVDVASKQTSVFVS